ncbi:hypothetical protein FKM82_011268 [Ascaphus truei]
MKKRIKEDNLLSCAEHGQKGTENIHLKRELGLFSAVSLIAGTMIGSGIFMSPEWVLRNMGSPGSSLLIWAACGLLAMLGALSYAELGTVIKESGGEYIYILRNFGTFPAFLLAYTTVIVVGPAGIAAISLSFAEYVVTPFYQGCPSPPLVVKCAAAACVLVLVVINCLNVRLATSIMNIFTTAKLLVLLVIKVGGVVRLIEGNTQVLQNAFENTATGFGPVGVAFYQGLWSYDGWNNLNYVTEELKNPEFIPMTVPIYSRAKVLGSWTWIISLGVAISTFGSANGSFFSGGRLCYVAAREGHMPDALSMAHVKRLTPSPALIFTSVISLIMIIPGNFSSIVNFFSFTAWVFYGITISGLLYIKIKKPDLPRPYKVPIIIPIIVLIASVYLVLAPIIDSPQMEYLYVILFILSGIIVYIPLVHYKWSPKCFRSITLQLQLLLEVAPIAKNT